MRSAAVTKLSHRLKATQMRVAGQAVGSRIVRVISAGIIAVFSGLGVADLADTVIVRRAVHEVRTIGKCQRAVSTVRR